MTRWLILRTSGGQTLALAASLKAAGFAVWTPSRTFRRQVRAKTPTGKRIIEIDAPILPTFVFAQVQHLSALAALASLDPSPHPSFSIFRYSGRVPIVGDCEIAGLRDKEARDAEVIAAVRQAETYAEADRIRRAAIKSASARRRAEQALERQQRADRRARQSMPGPGTAVEVVGTPALIGVTGVVEAIEGHYAHVRFGSLSWKIEGWQIMPSLNDTAPRSVAA